MGDIAASQNMLLGALTEGDAACLEPHLEAVDMPRRHVLERADQPVEHVYFPDTGLASTVAKAPLGRLIEVGIIGREGCTGSAVVMGNDRASYDSFMQIAGAGRRIESDALRRCMAESATLQTSLLHFVQAFTIQIGQTALSNAQAKLEERLCRWLLMCQDRVGEDELALTHEFLATMLGVRRAGVTTAIHILEGRGLVRARRGHVTILDRAGLEGVAEGYYGLPEREYERLVGVSLRASRS